MVLTGCRDKVARLWDTATGLPIGPPLVHYGSVDAALFRPDGRQVLTGGMVMEENVAIGDQSAWLWPVPLPLAGDAKRIAAWTQVVTGLQLHELGGIAVLDAAGWQERVRELQRLGGPPLP